MPIAFNPPPLPTPDRALATGADKAEDAANPGAEPFATVLSAATHALAGAAPAGTGTRLARGADGEVAARAARPAQDDDAEPTDASALVAALQALLPSGAVSAVATAPAGGSGIHPTATSRSVDAAASTPATTAGADGAVTTGAVPHPADGEGMTAAAVAAESPVAITLGGPFASLPSAVRDTLQPNGLPAQTDADRCSPAGSGRAASPRTPALAAAPSASTGAPPPIDVALPGGHALDDAPLPRAGAAAEAKRDLTDTQSAAVATAEPMAARVPSVHVVAIESPAFGTAWRQEVVHEIAQLVLLRHDSAELHVTPANLGPISVQVSMDAGQANLLVTAVQPATRDALELLLPQLRDSLAQQGITLGQASVQDERPRSSFAAIDKESRAGSPAVDGVAVRESVATPAVVRARGLIDLFA